MGICTYAGPKIYPLRNKFIHYETNLQLTERDGFYESLAAWPVSIFVEAVHFNLVGTLCNKFDKNNFCQVACGICFLVHQRANTSVPHSIAEQLFFMAG